MLRRIKNLILHRQPAVNNLSAGPWLKGNVRKGEFGSFDPPVNVALPSIIGEPQEGTSSLCSSGTWTGNPTPVYSYQWEIDGFVVVGADESSFTPPDGSAGKILTCVVTARNVAGTVSAPTAGKTISGLSVADGILFDTARGDSFLSNFVYTADPSLVVTADNISFDSATAKDLDCYYAIDGEEVGTCFDSFTLTFDVAINSGWATISQQAFESGFKSQVTGLYGVMTESHPGAAGNAYALRWMNGTPFGAGVSSSAVGAGIPATITVSLKAGVFTVLGIYGGVTVIDLTSPMTLGNPVDAYELPRMFSSLGINFILANMDVTSIKISVDYPNAKYAFVGDSLTQGRFASSYDEGYGPIIRQTYPDDVILCGAPGARIADWIAPNVAAVKKLSPKYVVIFLGTNDLPFVDAEVAKAEYDILANEFISSGFLVIAIGIPPANNYKTPIFNSLLQATYPRYVNCYTPLLGTGNAMNPAYDSGDGIHPNSAGHALIASTIEAAITANGWN